MRFSLNSHMPVPPQDTAGGFAKYLGRHALHTVAALLLPVALAACGQWPRAAGDTGPQCNAVAARVGDALRDGRIVLLGEVHDNPALHRERQCVVAAALRAGVRPAFVFEQFDRDAQDAIDAARREQPRDAAHLITRAAPARNNWNWDYYRPLLQLALDRELPIVAGNLSRADAMKLAQGPADAADGSLPATIPAAVREAQREEVRSGHCHLLPEAALAPMADAQIARDATMAQRIAFARSRGVSGAQGAGSGAQGAGSNAQGVLLFAGNGHVRRDIGVPLWLPGGALAASTTLLAIGFVETGTPDHAGPASDGRFDAIVYGPPANRPDPCIALKARLAK